MSEFEASVKVNGSDRMPLEKKEEGKMDSILPRVVTRRKRNIPSDELLKLLEADVDNRGNCQFENFSSIETLREFYETLPLNRSKHNIKNYSGGPRIPNSSKHVNIHANTNRTEKFSKLAEENNLPKRGQAEGNYSFDIHLETPCDVDSVLSTSTTELDDSCMDDITSVTLPPISPNRRNSCRRTDIPDYEGLSLLAKIFPDASIEELEEMHLRRINVGYDEHDETLREGENFEMYTGNDPYVESSVLGKYPKVKRVLKISIVVFCIFTSAMYIALAIYKSREQWMPVLGAQTDTQNFKGEHKFFEEYIREERAHKEVIETGRHMPQRDEEQVMSMSEEAIKSVIWYVEGELSQKEANVKKNLVVGPVSVEFNKSIDMVHSKKDFYQVLHTGKVTDVKQVDVKLAPQIKAYNKLMVAETLTKNESENVPKKADVTEHEIIKVSTKDITAEKLRLLELAVRRAEEEHVKAELVASAKFKIAMETKTEMMRMKVKLEIFEQNIEINLVEIEPNAKIERKEKDSVNFQPGGYELIEATSKKSSNIVKPTSRILLSLFDMYVNDSIISDYRLESKDVKESVFFSKKPAVLQRLYEMYDNDSILSRHKLVSNDEETRLSSQSPAILQRLYEMYTDETVTVQKSDRLSTNLKNTSEDFMSELFQRLFNMYANEKISKS